MIKTVKRIKSCLIAFFAIVFAITTLTLVATNVKRVAAAETATETFVMDDTGLTLRMTDGVGLRFKVKMSESLGSKIKDTDGVTLNFLVAPRAAFDIVNGNYATLVAAAKAATGNAAPARIQVADKGKIYEENGYYWASLVIVTSEANRTLDMSVVAYYTENEVDTFATTNVEKVRGNLYNVVNTTVLSDAELAKDILGNSEFGWYGAGNYPIEISTSEQAEVLKNSEADITEKIVLAKSSVEVPSEIAENVKTVTEQSVSGKADIVLGSGTSYAVNMGTLDGNVVKATIGGKAVSYADGKVTLNSDFKNRLVKHGDQTLTVTVEKDGAYTNYNKEVLIVTKEITTVDEIITVSGKIYGYYRLSADVGDGGSFFNVSNGGSWNLDGSLGFRGTFDGAGHSVTGAFAANGLFGLIGNGAVVKNTVFNVYYYQNGRGTLAQSITGATIDTITINIKSISGTLSTSGTGGIITSVMSRSTTYNKVTINASGKDLNSLFGFCYGNYDATKVNVFTSCVVNAKSLTQLLGYSGGTVAAANVDGLKITGA